MKYFVPRAFTALFVVSALAGAQTPPTKADVARIADSLGAAFMSANSSPSLAISIVRGSDTLVLRAWGIADREKNVAATPATIYRVGSVTKQFTSATVMQFVEQGRVALDSAIGLYLPTLPAAWRAVTVRQLLNHTSGVPSYTEVGPRWVQRWAEDMTPDAIVAITAKDTMWFAPGASWHYDNTGYVVLGMLIERIAGRAWSVDLVERIAKPLHLADTKVCDSRPTDSRAAKGYTQAGNGWTPAPYISMTQPYAAGSVCSTVGDLAKWNRALGTGQVVSAASYAAMTTPTGSAASSNYGFGLMRQSLGTHTVITHGGSVHGFVTGNAWVPDAELSITVLTNAASAQPDRLLQQLARVALGIPLVAALPRVERSKAERAPYTGVFSLQLPTGARDFTFTNRDDAVYAQLEGQSANALIPLGNHMFGAAFDPTLRITFTIENGRTTKLVLEQRGGTFDGPRKQ